MRRGIQVIWAKAVVAFSYTGLSIWPQPPSSECEYSRGYTAGLRDGQEILSLDPDLR